MVVHAYDQITPRKDHKIQLETAIQLLAVRHAPVCDILSSFNDELVTKCISMIAQADALHTCKGNHIHALSIPVKARPHLHLREWSWPFHSNSQSVGTPLCQVSGSAFWNRVHSCLPIFKYVPTTSSLTERTDEPYGQLYLKRQFHECPRPDAVFQKQAITLWNFRNWVQLSSVTYQVVPVSIGWDLTLP